ncbi:hypothetical protein [Clostridium sp. C2-6-12]|uniref:hypothetical protein n=1 Tax=Clostridium sp. C2-6-12 TaxID=2698832 RepID=UPI00136CB3FF|nr:hypothetical protein [Clostridium sp. C2-6-12]
MKNFDFSEKFSKYIPYLSEVVGLDLNFNHSLWIDPEISPNYGVKEIYSIGNSGHDYIVYLIIPGVSPEQYPIAIYNEENMCAKIISDSIKNWFPCYLVEKINDLLKDYDGFLKHPVEWSENFAERDLDSIGKYKALICESCKVFDNKPFIEALPEIFEVLQAKDISKWDYLKYLKLAAISSPLGQFIELKEKSIPKEDYVAFIKQNSHYNAPIFSQFKMKTKLGEMIARGDEIEGIPLEIALEVFKRRQVIDFGAGDKGGEILFLAAARCFEEMDKNSVYYPFIQEIAEFEEEHYNFLFSEWFYDLGNVLKKSGNIEEAVVAYENAIAFCSCENEEFHEDAFEALKSLVPHIKDENYVAYLLCYPDGEEEEEE